MAVTIFCVMLGSISTLVETPLVQSIYKAWKKRQEIHKLTYEKCRKKDQSESQKRSSKKEIELFSDTNVNPLYKGSPHGKQTHSTRIAII